MSEKQETTFPLVKARSDLGNLVKRASKGEAITIDYRSGEFQAVLVNPLVAQAGLLALGLAEPDVSSERRESSIAVLRGIASAEADARARRNAINAQVLKDLGFPEGYEPTNEEFREATRRDLRERSTEE